MARRIIRTVIMTLATIIFISCHDESSNMERYIGKTEFYRNYGVTEDLDSWNISLIPKRLIKEIKENRDTLNDILTQGKYSYDSEYIINGRKGQLKAHIKIYETFERQARKIKTYVFNETDAMNNFSVTSEGVYLNGEKLLNLIDYSYQIIDIISLSNRNTERIDRIEATTSNGDRDTVYIKDKTWDYMLVRESISEIILYEKRDVFEKISTMRKE